MQTYQNYINGTFVGGYENIEVFNPAKGQPFALQAIANSQQVKDAVQAARKSFLESNFKNLRPVERGRMVRKMGEYLLLKEQEIAELLTMEAGKPLWE